MAILVDDPEDPRVAPYRAVRERDLVGRDGQFVAEGEVVLRVLLGQRRHAVESVLVAASRVDGLSPLLDAVPPDVPVYAAGQAVMDRIVGFPIHRGILAVGCRVAMAPPEALLAPPDRPSIVVVLVGIANHDNMGGIFRNAAGFGADAVLLDAACCDPLYRKAIRVSVGGTLVVPFARLAAGADPVVLLEAAGYVPLALSPGAATPLAALDPPARAAVILGAEGPGLPESLIARARGIAIPMAGGFDSLNVATTSGIVLHHLAAQAGGASAATSLRPPRFTR